MPTTQTFMKRLDINRFDINRFVLIHKDGRALYPYKERDDGSGNYAFVAGTGKSGGKKHGQEIYVDTIEELVKLAVREGKPVCAMPLDGSAKPTKYSLRTMAKIEDYELAEDLLPIVDGPWRQPRGAPPTQSGAHVESSGAFTDALLNEGARQAAEEDVNSDPQCADCTVTERKTLVDARLGQGRFRKDVLALWDDRCALTDCDMQQLLIASHALPWAESTNTQRLDKHNGLPLIPNLDKLFDRGFIGFSDDGSLILSPRLSEAAIEVMGLRKHQRLRRVPPACVPYLKDHRTLHRLGR